jgi:hypothetical protein
MTPLLSQSLAHPQIKPSTLYCQEACRVFKVFKELLVPQVRRVLKVILEIKARLVQLALVTTQLHQQLL